MSVTKICIGLPVQQESLVSSFVDHQACVYCYKQLQEFRHVMLCELHVSTFELFFSDDLNYIP